MHSQRDQTWVEINSSKTNAESVRVLSLARGAGLASG